MKFLTVFLMFFVLSVSWYGSAAVAADGEKITAPAEEEPECD